MTCGMEMASTMLFGRVVCSGALLSSGLSSGTVVLSLSTACSGCTDGIGAGVAALGGVTTARNGTATGDGSSDLLPSVNQKINVSLKTATVIDDC